MPYSQPATRHAYRAGAREAVETLICRMDGAHALELRHWLDELGAWVEGPPPEAPYLW